MIYFRVPGAIWKIRSIFSMLAGLLAPAVSFARQGPETKESAAAVLETVLERHGVEEARSRFSEMRNEEDKFDFDAREFVELGRGYYRGNKIEEAVTILEMAVELFPETGQGHFLLACAYWKMDEPALAMSSRQKMQSVQDKATLAEFIETYGDSLYPPSYPFMKSVMSLWDYRDVGGIMIPHVFIRNMGGLGPPHGGVVEEVQVNVPLDDSLFVKPR